MKNQELYGAWKKNDREVEISETFAGRVMNEIYAYEQRQSRVLLYIQRLVELAAGRPLVKTALVAAGALVGIVRIAFVVCLFLRT